MITGKNSSKSIKQYNALNDFIFDVSIELALVPGATRTFAKQHYIYINT
jgi:hypothetical protein